MSDTRPATLTMRALLGDRTLRAPLVAVIALTLVAAASEAGGFVLLVPLIEDLGRTQGGGAGVGGGAWAGLSLAQMLALFVVLVTVRAMAELLRALAAQSLTVRLVDGLRDRAVAGLIGAEWRALSRMDQSANRALLVSTIDRIGYATELLVEALRLGMGLVALAAAAFVISPMVALGGLIAGVLTTLVHSGLRRRARLLGEDLTRNHARITLRLEQTLDALRLVKSFGREQAARAGLAEGFAQMREVETRFIRDSGVARAGLQIVGAAMLAVLVLLAITQWSVEMAVLLPLVALILRALPLLAALQATMQRWRHDAPALEAVRSLIAEVEAAAEPTPAPPPLQLAKAIVLEQVGFRHDPARAALSGIDATIPARAITVLTGPSGAGKSTVADLVGGLLAPDSGRILIDGAPLNGGARIAWRHRVAYVQQEPVLFAGTVRDNLLWADATADEGRMAIALERAAADFVHALPGGLDCDLGAAGRALSGGERQRIALARALLRDPDLLILDEATSALDDGSERAIAAAVAALAGQCTVLVIGHRGALTGLAQHRIHLERGRVVPG